MQRGGHDRRVHRDLRGQHRAGAERYQARARVLHRQPAGLHVPGARRGRVLGAGVFHLFTHAFFKALLFLGSGSVIHAMGGEQDMRYMGGLRRKIPITLWTMLVGSLAIAGIPGLAGFFSKDEILWQACRSERRSIARLWVVGVADGAMTAFYMFRLMFLTFFGKLG